MARQRIHRMMDWAAFLDAAQKPGAWIGASTDDNVGFRGTATYEEAYSLLRDGWREGRDRFVSGLSSLAPPTIRQAHRNLDVAGAYPVVPLAVSGDPACMVDMGETITPRPVVCLVVGFSCSVLTTRDQITNRGVALASIIDAMETAGTRIELIAERRAETGDFDISHAVTVKEADQPLELDRLAFVLAHPSMLRRIAFRLEEQVTTINWRQGYGAPTLADASDFPDAILIPSLINNGSAFNSPEQALATVIQQCRDAGMDITTD